MKTRVVHVISGLKQGGAEAALIRLCASTRERWQHHVISLSGSGYYGPQLESLGVPVVRASIGTLPDIVRTIATLSDDPHGRLPIIQSWMYHGDAAAAVIKVLFGGKLVWGVHNGGMLQSDLKPSTLWTAKACALMSSTLPDAIVCCSRASQSAHISTGYNRRKVVYIPNGYDLEKFRRDESLRSMLRRHIGLNCDLFVGIVARWDPVKDHMNFLRAARICSERGGQRIGFVMCGSGVDSANLELVRSVEELGLKGRVALLGARGDVCAVMNALDINVLSSRSEAFPNVVAEAMACEVPCIVTNVGDAAYIVGSSGWVVPRGNSAALAAAIMNAVGDMHALRERGRAARRRIEDNFSNHRMCDAYESLWLALANRSSEIL